MDNQIFNYTKEEQHVFVIGSKGIPASYGGFESFLEKLTYYKKETRVKYHIACMGNNNNIFEHNGARCFNVKVPNFGPAKAVYYDVQALKECIGYIKKMNIENPIIYVLACRIGPFIGYYKQKIKELNGTLYLNPDGHEWKRDKWNWLIKRYWKLSEKLMVKHSDLSICDSKIIEQYIKADYSKYSPKTTYISYGAELEKSNYKKNDQLVVNWFLDKKISLNEYYLIVGRFVPENNYEAIIREFMKTDTKKDLVIITNLNNDKFYNKLKNKTNFTMDSRIKFVGTVYDQDLLKIIRKNAFAYLHGHEVGGTNPSLLEALGCTDLNLLLDVDFNKEVGGSSALYWSKEEDALTDLIKRVEDFDIDTIEAYGRMSRSRIMQFYSWDNIVNQYEYLFGRKLVAHNPKADVV